ncbi:MAG TPA: glycosyltransferase family 4 protein [Gaiellaceae bacterium]
MRKLIFATQKLDPEDPILGATVPMVRALAARVDELVVLCDSAVSGAVPANVRVHAFGAATQAQRGLKFTAALARELRPRPIGVIAHMVPLYALLAAPLVRPLRIPLVLWYTQWKGHAVLRAAERVSTAVISVDRKSFPLASRKVRGIGHGIDIDEFPCSEGPSDGGPVRAIALGRYSPAKGLEAVLRGVALAGGVRLEAYGPTGAGDFAGYRRDLERLAEELGVDAELKGPVARSEVPALFARSHVLINNTLAGGRDKVVYEAAAGCLPVLASNGAFRDVLSEDLIFDGGDPASLAARLRSLDRRRRPELREAVAAHHSVEHWADGVLATVAGEQP